MSQEISPEERRANIARWRHQDRLMLEHGFATVHRMKASRKPCAYEHLNGYWRVKSARYGKWDLQRWYGRSITPKGHCFDVKIWSPVQNYFDTPLAVALWFNILKRAGVI